MGMPAWEIASNEEAVDLLSESGERPISRDARESLLRLEDEETPAFESALDCFGVPVAFATWDSLCRWFFESARSRARLPKVMYFANAHTLNVAWSSPAFRALLG